MKLTVRTPTPPPLWRWLTDKLPRGLCAYKHTRGYGESFGVTVRVRGMHSWRDVLCPSSPVDAVALVEGLSLVLYFPEWTSDFQDLLLRYEAETALNTELIVCQSS